MCLKKLKYKISLIYKLEELSFSQVSNKEAYQKQHLFAFAIDDKNRSQ